MERTLISFIVIILLSSYLTANTGLEALNINTSAKANAMGGVYAGIMEDGIRSLNGNPAGISELKFITVSFTHLIWLHDISIENGTFGIPTGIGNFGLTGKYLYTNPENYINFQGESSYELNYNTLLLTLAFSRKIFDIGVGMNIKFANETIGTVSAQAYMADIGIQKRFGGLGVGLVGRNIGIGPKYHEESVQLPMSQWLELSYTFPVISKIKLTTAVDTGNITDEGIHVGIGEEIDLYNIFFIRGGYKMG